MKCVRPTGALLANIRPVHQVIDTADLKDAEASRRAGT